MAERRYRTAGWVLGTSVAIAATLSAGVSLGGSGRPLPGPPGICTPIDIGSQREVIDKEYAAIKPADVVGGIIALLDKHQDHAMLRMEILRRAIGFGDSKGAQVPDALMLRLAVRAAALAGNEKKDVTAAALFDAGYWIYQRSVLDESVDRKLGEAEGLPGYGLIRQALKIKDDNEMSLGATFATLPAMHGGDGPSKAKFLKLFKGHATDALKGAPAGGEIERNLTYFLSVEGLSIDDVRAKPTPAAPRTTSTTGPR
ncbi:MAG: hypothetical protein AABZ53_00835 [Planctomycetota bacterium]